MVSLLIDGNSLINRAFYALPVLTTDEGVYTNAVYGFLRMFYKAVDEIRPDRVVCAFDVKHPTFRHEKYAEYKAGRKKMPEELVPQIPLLKEVLGTLGVYCAENPGWEADDIIGTYARLAEEEGNDAVILTGDRDSFQLISAHTSVWFTRKGITEVDKLTPDNLPEVYGVRPDQVCDLKALMGDSSDNIPGVPGIGEKTARALLSEYGTLDALYEHADNIPGKMGEKLREGKDSATESRFLVTIVRNVPVEDPEKTAYVPAPDDVAAGLFRKYQLNSLLERVGGKEAEEPPFSCGTRPWSEFEFSGKKLAVAFFDGEIFVACDEKTQYRLAQANDLFSLSEASEESLIEALAPLMADETVEKVFFDSKAARKKWPVLAGVRGDCLLAAYLLASGESELTPEGVCESFRAEKSACALFYIFEKQKKALESKGLWKLYEELELPLAAVLHKMEETGFHVSEPVLRDLGVEFSGRLGDLAKEIYTLAGREFNINSTQQLGEILFDTLGLPAGKKTKRGYSTDNDVLEGLEHPIAPCVIEYRQLQKLKSTYIDGMFPVISDRDGRVHTTFRQAVTSTGRLSSTEPNLQNIPVRTAEGRRLRRAFTAPEGYCLVNADYSQIELRLLAHLSGDETLINAFRAGEDIHARTAAELAGIDIAEVTGEQRAAAKAVNFGIIYGISDFGLARNVHISRREAADYIERYFERYPRVKEYMRACVEEAKRSGHATTLLSRRREIPQLRSSNFNVRSFGERVAMNTPIQGSAADIIKEAMLRVDRLLTEKPALGKLILQVHDELILETPEENAAEAMKALKDVMEHVAELSVPLIADANAAKTWYELK